MSSVLVIGATGLQGGSVINAALTGGHDVTAFVRDPSSNRATALADRGVHLHGGDLSDAESLAAAMSGADSVYAMTTVLEGHEAEVEYGYAIVDAVASARPAHFVFSSVASADEGTGIGHFESKWKVEKRLADLDTRWTVVAPVFFMNNYLYPWNTVDIAKGQLRDAVDADVPLQMVDVRDIGATAVAVMEDPDRFAGRRIEIAGDELTGPDTARALASGIGRPLEYEVKPLAEVAAFGDDMVRMYEWFNAGGYSVDIAGLADVLPTVDFHSAADFARDQDWESILES